LSPLPNIFPENFPRIVCNVRRAAFDSPVEEKRREGGVEARPDENMTKTDKQPMNPGVERLPLPRFAAGRWGGQ